MGSKWDIVVLLEVKELDKNCMVLYAFKIIFYPYSCVAPFVVGRYSTEREARGAVTHYLRAHRRCGYPIVLVKPGKEWQINEPLRVYLTPPECGILCLKKVNLVYSRKSA